MTSRIDLAAIALALASTLALSVACGPAAEPELSASGIPAGFVGSAQTGAGHVDPELGLVSSDPPPPAPASIVDPMDPWSSLGVLTGGYRLSVERIENDCRSGPDVPARRTSSASYGITLTQRGSSLAFELGEGVVFAEWDPASGRLQNVERVGAEGVTSYLDGFAVTLRDETTEGTVISGESAWRFKHEGRMDEDYPDEFYASGEECFGRTRWRAERFQAAPNATPRDLQIVLRWPVESGADLDLTIEPNGYADWRRELAQVDFSDGLSGCYQLHASGTAVADAASAPNPFDDFVADLGETTLPYHEEVIRCRYADYGWWYFQVTNWSQSETVDYELEVFWGPRVNTTRRGERSFGAQPETAAPLTRNQMSFKLLPPPRPGGNASGTVTVGIIGVVLHPTRPLGPVTGTFLEFNKAAYEGLSYDAFLSALGL